MLHQNGNPARKVKTAGRFPPLSRVEVKGKPRSTHCGGGRPMRTRWKGGALLAAWLALSWCGSEGTSTAGPKPAELTAFLGFQACGEGEDGKAASPAVLTLRGHVRYVSS